MNLPENFHLWNPAMRGAYMKGTKAAESGEGLSSCPYQDKRKDGGQLTWSRAFIRAWEDGWTDFKSQQDPITQYYEERARRHT